MRREILRGAGRCPRCGSRKVARTPLPDTRFYGREVEVCGNCGAYWEPFDPAELLDKGEVTSSFIEPCDNCAFRPDSPEQRNTEEWKKLMANLEAAGQFFCHKGVPIAPETENGFAYPADRSGKYQLRKMRLCRGFLRMWGARMDKQFRGGDVQD